eukprot:COSAG06_NODE_124_length_22969_cov_136.895310_2_plen_61_part_00
MYIPRELLVNLVEEYPELGQNIAKYAFERYQEGKSYIEPVRPHQLLLAAPSKQSRGLFLS